MSDELTKARSKLAGVAALLKQNKHMAAVQAVHDGLILILKSPLMKNEKEEFARQLSDVVYTMNADQNLRKHYPLVIKYEPGAEKALFEVMQELLKVLQNAVTEEVQGDAALIERQKRESLDKGQAHLDRQEFDEARKVFDKLVREFKNDTSLAADIADRFLKAERFQDAYEYLEEALRHEPNAIYLYNRIGIVLRKMKDFETAEKYYFKALEISKDDEFLHFNMGRLYADQGQWKKVLQSAERALKINPSFAEAEKMRSFAEKKLGG